PSGEIILSSGALHSPKLLQLSGVGPADHLRSLGIEIVHDSPGVGANMVEQRGLNVAYRLKQPLGLNSELHGFPLFKNILRYMLCRPGPLATCSHEAQARATCNPESTRCDTTIGFASISLAENKAMQAEPQPGMTMMAMPIRPQSRGSIMIRSADPD